MANNVLLIREISFHVFLCKLSFCFVSCNKCERVAIFITIECYVFVQQMTHPKLHLTSCQYLYCITLS